MASQDELNSATQQALPSSDNAAPSSPAAIKHAEQALSNPRVVALNNKRVALESTLTELQSQRASLVAKTTLPSGLAMPVDWSDEQKEKTAHTNANAVIKEHIGLLHRYNEIKDIGQDLMGLIADQRGVRIAEVMEEFGLASKD
ncbi:hypothetical protein LTR56_005114 [Elasticomyces elasticus]|nr:hypothetical protein LTR22_022005 [Elasticomyces elasticus]KAK3652404.1 hypothetical protein LTR56_005114 [Elasticomyces elasticus]KAK4921272.1 hypothetical protein LTR49_011275 [Elasticomyces elasticus]KAK5759716.1 hypothetical protein LTS12_010233 [Elasticomyces elasticus]